MEAPIDQKGRAGKPDSDCKDTSSSMLPVLDRNAKTTIRLGACRYCSAGLAGPLQKLRTSLQECVRGSASRTENYRSITTRCR